MCIDKVKDFLFGDYEKQIASLKGEIDKFKKDIETKEETINKKDLTISELSSQKSDLIKEINSLNEEVDSLEDRVSFCNDKIEKYIKDKEELELEEFYNSKYPDSTIKYISRSFPFSTEKVAVPMNVLVTPDDPDVIDFLKKWKLYQTGEDPETLIPKIYNKVKKELYAYLYDEQVWNSDEVFEFPFEMISKIKKALENNKKQGFDCDSWSILLESMYIAAGVPRWRCRICAGKCKLGGHSTNEVFSMLDRKWHHLNSTYGFPTYSKISQYPTHSDIWSPTNTSGKDLLGIYDYYFSYNDKYIWKKNDVSLDSKYITN